MGSLPAASEHSARKWARVRTWPHIEPSLTGTAIDWRDVLSILETLDTLEEFQQAMDDPEQFMGSLVAASAHSARQWAFARA